MSDIRTAEKAGAWYAADKVSLERELEKFLQVADSHIKGKVVAGVVPHAGMAFSGGCAAKTFSAIKSSFSEVETFVLLGAVHTMRIIAPAVWGSGIWQTPLGDIAIDEELAQDIMAQTDSVNNLEPHYGDNALEMQMPFIKYLFPEAKIVPIAVPVSEGAVSFGEQLFSVINNSSRKVAVIGSTDFTHYGACYGFVPAGMGREALYWGKENDQRLIKLAISLDAEDIVPTAEHDRSACGAGALAATVAYANKAGVNEGQLLEHTTSYEIMPQGECEMFVGYASIIFAV